MESHPSVTDRPVRIPVIVWFLGAGLIAAVVAIFFFNVALNTVASYGFFALMIGSHFFMHGAHGGHGGQQHNTKPNAPEPNENNPVGRSGGCH
jgi:hypothetical protein